jgi:hypothetical protein
MYRNLVTFLDYFNSIFRDLLSKNQWFCDIKSQNFRTVRNVIPNRKPAVTIFFCFTRVQMVGPCGDGLACLSMEVDQRLLGGFRNLLSLSGGKTHNLGTPDDRSEISPSRRKRMTVYTRCLDYSLYSCWVIYIDRMRVVYTWWSSRTVKSPCNQSHPFLSLPATTGK